MEKMGGRDNNNMKPKKKNRLGRKIKPWKKYDIDKTP